MPFSNHTERFVQLKPGLTGHDGPLHQTVSFCPNYDMIACIPEGERISWIHSKT